MSENEQEKRKTLEDIVREKRSMAAKIRANLSTVPVRREDQLLEAEELDREADRIEAAWKWERDEIEAQALSIGGIVEASRHKPGNAAAMREAFKRLDEEMSFCERNVELRIGFAHEGLREHCRIVRQILNAALSEPARNCDMFDDAEIARQAWLDDAENWDDFGSPKLELYEWLLALAAERKGDGDGR